MEDTILGIFLKSSSWLVGNLRELQVCMDTYKYTSIQPTEKHFCSGSEKSKVLQSEEGSVPHLLCHRRDPIY